MMAIAGSVFCGEHLIVGQEVSIKSLLNQIEDFTEANDIILCLVCS